MQRTHRSADVGHGRAQITVFQARCDGDHLRQIFAHHLRLTCTDTDLRNTPQRQQVPIRGAQRQTGQGLEFVMLRGR